MSDNNEMLYVVGEKYEHFKTGQDGYIMEWGEHGMTLFAMLNGNIGEWEKNQFSTSADFSIRYAIINDICFFSVCFGELPWGDMPFSPALYKNIGQAPKFEKIEDGKGLSLLVLLINSETGELVNIRYIGLEHDFSVKWQEWAQKAVDNDMRFEDYHSRIDKVYNDYASVDIAKAGEDKECVIKGNYFNGELNLW